MKYIALLRGVTPTGQNKIPKMSYLREILIDAGFPTVKTYLQSGNLLLNTDLSSVDASVIIHDCIKQKIGADLSVIMKQPHQLQTAVMECPFDDTYDSTRIHLVFSNDVIDRYKLEQVSSRVYEGEEFAIGSECMYLYLPRDAAKKVLHTNYLERKLGITATMRKLSVIRHLCEA